MLVVLFGCKGTPRGKPKPVLRVSIPAKKDTHSCQVESKLWCHVASFRIDSFGKTHWQDRIPVGCSFQNRGCKATTQRPHFSGPFQSALILSNSPRPMGNSNGRARFAPDPTINEAARHDWMRMSVGRDFALYCSKRIAQPTWIRRGCSIKTHKRNVHPSFDTRNTSRQTIEFAQRGAKRETTRLRGAALASPSKTNAWQADWRSRQVKHRRRSSACFQDASRSGEAGSSLSTSPSPQVPKSMALVTWMPLLLSWESSKTSCQGPNPQPQPPTPTPNPNPQPQPPTPPLTPPNPTTNRSPLDGPVGRVALVHLELLAEKQRGFRANLFGFRGGSGTFVGLA